MNKLCLPFRHLFFIFLAFISLSFSFTSKVEAYEFTVTYSNDYSIFTNENYSSLIEWLDGKQSVYFLYLTSSNDLQAKITKISPLDGTISCTAVSSYFLQCTPSGTTLSGNVITYNIDPITLTNTGSSIGGSRSININNQRDNTGVTLLYTNAPITNNTGSVLTITDNTNTNICENGASCDWLLLSTWFDTYYVPPTPPDDTPLLTSFYETTIDRLSYLCDYIVSSYLYLAIFSIFILYFVILLIRRLR